MKKNLPLYILLIFLIIMNGFFLYNYLGTYAFDKHINERKPPGDFLAEQLDFDNEQKETFDVMVLKHRQESRRISDDIRELKDELFLGLSDDTLDNVNRDSIAALIGKKQKQMDLLTFNYFKNVHKLCNSKQKEKFSKIIQDALRRESRGQGPPPGGRRDSGDRPPRPDGPNGDRPPPPEH